MIVPPNKTPTFFGKKPDFTLRCPFCNYLLLVFLPPNKPQPDGIRVGCVCGKQFTFLEKLTLTEIEGIEENEKSISKSNASKE